MDDIGSINWMPVPKAPYIIKYAFYDTGYHIMITNLTSLYAEKLEKESILKRFSDLNSFAEMKLPVILENLKKSLEKCMNQEAELSINLTSDKLFLSLEFNAGPVLCKYKFEMSLLPADKLTENIITPLVFNALLSHKEISELKKKMKVYESFSSIKDIRYLSQDPIDPDWLKGKNVSSDNLLNTYLKVEKCSKDLHADNLEAYNEIQKEKLKWQQTVQSVSSNKKVKLQENIDGGSSSITFQDNDVKIISIKQNESLPSNNVTSQTKGNLKKKKGFKI